MSEAHGPVRYDAEAVADDYVPPCRTCGEPWPCPGRRSPLDLAVDAVDEVLWTSSLFDQGNVDHRIDLARRSAEAVIALASRAIDDLHHDVETTERAFYTVKAERDAAHVTLARVAALRDRLSQTSWSWGGDAAREIDVALRGSQPSTDGVSVT